MLGEEKNWPPDGTPARRLCDLLDAHPDVTLTALGYEELPGGGCAYNLGVLWANGDEVQVTVD